MPPPLRELHSASPAPAPRDGALCDVHPDDVRSAAKALRPHVLETPVEHSPWLSSRAGVPIHLKLECFQRTRSFKARGAFHALLELGPTLSDRPIIAASAGNHGLGIALAARELGGSAIVYVPEEAPETKVRRISELDAEVRLVAGGYDDAQAEAVRRAAAGEGRFVHPFDDPDVVAGQGTVGLELVRALPEVEEVVVPVGGGGLLAGIGAALGESAVRITGVQGDRTRAMHDAFVAGHVVPTEDVPTLADGLAGGVSAPSYRRARAVTAAIRLIPEDSLAKAIRLLYRHHGIVAEGSAAVTVAAILEGAVQPSGPTALVVSGGNIDAGRLASILST